MDVPQPDPVLGAIHEEPTMARKQVARAARLADTATPSLEDEQEMLCLALLAHRGLADENCGASACFLQGCRATAWERRRADAERARNPWG